MSRVFDLLDNVKNRPDAKDIHPALKQAVFATRDRQTSRWKNLLLAGVAITSVFFGAGLKYYLEVVRPQHPLAAKAQKMVAVDSATQPMPDRPPVTAAAPTAAAAPVEQTSLPAMLPSNPVAAPAPLPAVQHPPPIKPGLEKGAQSPAYVKKRQELHGVAAKDEQPEAARPAAGDTSQRDRYLLSAREMESRRDYEQAVKYSRLALELSPDNYRLLNNIAGLSLQMGKHKDAAAAAQRALQLKRDFLPALINLGIAQAAMGNGPQAMVTFARALSLDQGNKGALYNMALLQERSGNAEEAAIYYRRLADGGDPRGLLGMGRTLEKQRKWGEAAAAYREVLSAQGATIQEKNAAEERLNKLGR
jgi:tetratricopeptide (TPR) repeat protein